jgi:hypothetical protein
MACLLYHNSTLRDCLKVCGLAERIGYAPSGAHIKLFCLSISAFRECPEYKRKMSKRKELCLTDGLLKAFLKLFLAKKREKQLKEGSKR